MPSKVVYVTGSDTGVGKTLLTVLLTRHLRAQGVRVRAVKPIASGGREDAVALRACQPEAGSLEVINPWTFRAPITPLLAARKEKRVLRLASVVDYLRQARQGWDLLIVEGAGGVLSPLGDGCSGRELIAATKATPIVVCANRLGAINQALLVLEVLPRSLGRRAHLVLMNGAHQDAATRTNASVLRELSQAAGVQAFPWLGAVVNPVNVPIRGRLKKALTTLAAALQA